METSLYFPKQICSTRTGKDVEAACKILLRNAVESYELIGKPEIQLVTYEITQVVNNHKFVNYPLWRQEIRLTINGRTVDYQLYFHEVDQSLSLHRVPKLYETVDAKPVGRQFFVSKGRNRIKTIYDDTFLATAKQAKHKLIELIPRLCWEDIYSVKPKILKDGRPIWLISCENDWKYALDIVTNPTFQYRYYTANFLSIEGNGRSINPLFANLQNPVIGSDYFAFNYRQKRVRDVTNLMALRFTEEGFVPIRLSQAKLPAIDLTGENGEEWLKYL